MIEYRGFQLPSDPQEAVLLVNSSPPCPVGPHLVVHNADGIRLTTAIPVEYVLSPKCDFDKTLDEVCKVVDWFLDSRPQPVNDFLAGKPAVEVPGYEC